MLTQKFVIRELGVELVYSVIKKADFGGLDMFNLRTIYMPMEVEGCWPRKTLFFL